MKAPVEMVEGNGMFEVGKRKYDLGLLSNMKLLNILQAQYE